MTSLLVSVRNASEAVAALEGGADLIDIKEPHRGSLGAADELVQRDIIERAANRVPVSAACGELLELDSVGAPQSVAGIRFAKVGLAGCGSVDNWTAQWSAWSHRLAPGTRAVAVAYADWRTCDAPTPDAVLSAASRLGGGAVLIDTFDKQKGDLFSYCPIEMLRDFVSQVHAKQLLSVVAGSLRLDTLEMALTLEPSYVAVRGAVCRGDRTGAVDAMQVAEWAARIMAVVPARTAD